MRGRVLCVDDDRNLCQILGKALASEGYEVETAFDGDRALEKAAQAPPDLLLLDLILPRRDGFAVLERLRAAAGSERDTPVVVVSGCTPTKEYRHRAQQLRVAEVVTKPVPLEDLLSLVSRTIRGGQPEPAKPAAAPGASSAGGAGLAGSLRRLPLPEVLHHLHGLRATGVLHLSSGRRRKWIGLRDGYPCAVRSNLVNECLGNFLVRSGRIPQSALDESRRRMQGGRLQGEILVAMQVLSEAQVSAALREQADEKLFEAFGWSSGSFRFEKGADLQGANAIRVDRSPANLILRGVRERFPAARIDAFLRSHADCFLAPGESPFYQFQEIDLEPAEASLLSGLDGSRHLSDFLDSDAGLRSTLYALVSVGLLRLVNSGGGAAPSPTVQRSARRGSASDDAKRAELAATLERLGKQTLFEILDVDAAANENQIRAAHGRLAERFHPDRYSSSTAPVRRMAEEVFGLVTRAYETLSDSRRRGEYLLDQRRKERVAAEAEASKQALEAEKLFQRGRALLANRAYPRALECFRQALELSPGVGEYHAQFGWALHLCSPDDRKVIDQAIEHVRRGIKLAGHSETTYLIVGRLFKAKGDPEKAEKLFSRAVQLEPDNVEALRELRLMAMRREKNAKGLIGRLIRR